MATTISTRNGYKPSYIPAAIAALLVFLLYLATLAPSVAMWDTGEYMAAAKVLGIPHPPGNPFFVLLAHAFGSLPIPVSYAAKINILAALASAARMLIFAPYDTGIGNEANACPSSMKNGLPGGWGRPRTLTDAMYSPVSHIATEGARVAT